MDQLNQNSAAGDSQAPVSLGELARIAGADVPSPAEGWADVAVSSVGLNAREVAPGGLFAALPGTRVHGAQFAAESPARAILTDREGLDIVEAAGDRRPVLVVDDARAVLGEVSAHVYGHPSRRMTLIGVTGTSGKTTTTYLLERGLIAAGAQVGLIGTTGTRIRGRDVPTSLTTPEAPTLQALFARMAAEGVTHVVMEVSSHALSLGRVGGTSFDAAGFTNLSQDHLDFHPTMEDYFEAKAAFFDPASSVAASTSVICVDDEWGERMAQLASRPLRVGTHGQDGLDCSARLIRVRDNGAQDIELRIDAHTHAFTLQLPGAFNVANAALATALARVVGADVAQFVRGLEDAAVPGRMERIDAGQGFVAVVDYAHKPAAIAAVLETLREQVDGRIGIAVGAGGDRDTTKRAVMGREAATRADFVIVTDDNPRTEDPASIRAAVLDGAREAGSDAEIRECGSRAEAIDQLVAWAQPGDAVVVVGKGHEVGQIIGETTHHFDDREEMRRALAENGYGENDAHGTHQPQELADGKDFFSHDPT
ncbi:UDP-N-acetylmuramoyl-L-alanyl-D-glutamate--2,6-diaminopimelate ligase [Corynebacterium sanguinis]|uniref:UDP-N-acetylmuramoyl-L-alanyl-D-glutamate--2, 6-diaminopimelate ligase n=1 Tax=Corynebacterium TaxID=1716 RepID=UPI0010AB35C1|nr:MULTISPECIES: UDP-N-acetylmuramoyl-L-alanyl-D-glutamate--2,6-diaminopimelate ligase [Corynebacterium]MCT1462735.1 UDP-N-acetylmuramoyl-L-alanyl-D-glutamate--2,6-diaminopimelate ligase [Corynebacterium sanguinis]MCT1499056.1 UDP-N-acetylmuramoyl-L-alanyl-D-glutamate--2,6-diaminopimelate ligase [Corynebacterium sanguinis]MCT1554964.1 UDP-N-acetylmuramoyl-L-alanyl-D-glutamate--2,6-diaminopimelate ligase [Corynebacterium sanguinis]MCT1583738.1 UDP-N-acetylmuramoyl-L-alanyl-D-glutamate--2,6-diami